MSTLKNIRTLHDAFVEFKTELDSVSQSSDPEEPELEVVAESDSSTAVTLVAEELEEIMVGWPNQLLSSTGIAL